MKRKGGKTMINPFKQKKVTFLDNKWEVLKTGVNVSAIPRAHELVYLNNQYYRVCNVIYNVIGDNCDNIFVVIELHTDDFKLIEKNKKNNLTNR